jgi:hypothetical protein
MLADPFSGGISSRTIMVQIPSFSKHSLWEDRKEITQEPGSNFATRFLLVQPA